MYPLKVDYKLLIPINFLKGYIPSSLYQSHLHYLSRPMKCCSFRK